MISRLHADHGSGQELVLALLHYNARVVRRAASSSLSSEKAPRTRSISEYWMVARLSVMITESINKPDPFALSLRSEERRVGKRGDIGGRRIIKKKKRDRRKDVAVSRPNTPGRRITNRFSFLP